MLTKSQRDEFIQLHKISQLAATGALAANNTIGAENSFWETLLGISPGNSNILKQSKLKSAGSRADYQHGQKHKLDQVHRCTLCDLYGLHVNSISCEWHII